MSIRHTSQGRRTRLAGFVAGAAAAGAALALSGAASHEVDPGAVDAGHVAPWINKDGTLDRAAMPEIVPVYGTDGRIVTRDGVQMGIRTADLYNGRADEAVDRYHKRARPGDGAGDVTPASESLAPLLVPLEDK